MKLNEIIVDDEWEWYIGELFSKVIKDNCKFKLENVVEIAPGFRYKIAYALKNVNFSGNLYIIDTNVDVLEYVSKKYKELVPKARIICINKKFEESFDEIPNNIDLLLSNHCIDDMIISEYIKEAYNENLNNEIFKEILTKAWTELGKNKEEVNKITSKVFMTFKDFFEIKNIETIIISQYKSNAYFKDDFKEMDEITETCFKKIKKLVITDDERVNEIFNFYPFGDDERYKGEYLLNNTQNAKNWIVGVV